MRSRPLLAAVVAVALVLTPVLTSTVASASTTTTYKWYSGVRSPMYLDSGPGGGCRFGVWYGVYGTQYFAKIRFYGGPCGGTIASIDVCRLTECSPPNPTQSSSTGVDPCGPYIEVQSAVERGSWTLWGMDVGFFGSSGNVRNFKGNGSNPMTPYRSC